MNNRKNIAWLSLLLVMLFVIGGAASAADGRVSADANGFSLESPDGRFGLRMNGLLQVDGRLFVDDDAPGEDDELLLRRARLTFDGRFGERIAFRLRPEASSGVTNWIDAYVDVKFDGLALRAGKFKPPVGLERLQSAGDLRLVERSFVTELVPSRDVGVQLEGSTGAFSWQLAMLNGVDDGRTADVADDGRFELAGRVFVDVLNAADAGGPTLGFGLGATAGEREGSPVLPLLSGIRSPAQETIFRYRSGTDGTYADGERWRLSPQACWYLGPVGLMAEWVTSRNTVRRAGRAEEIDHVAWEVSAEWNLTGEPTRYRGAPPPGTVQLVARIEALDIGDEAFAGGAGSFADPAVAVRGARSGGIGLNWFPLAGIKSSLIYRQTTFDGGAASGDRPDEKVVLARIQFTY